MPQYNDDVPCPKGVVALLTPSGPVASARIQARGGGLLRVQATATNVAPAVTAFRGAIDLIGGMANGYETDRTISERYPGVLASGATGWLWGLADADMAASVSHA